jgi:hypothetical protein
MEDISRYVSFNLKGNVMVGYAVAECLRHYATSGMVAGSRPSQVNDLYQFT